MYNCLCHHLSGLVYDVISFTLPITLRVMEVSNQLIPPSILSEWGFETSPRGERWIVYQYNAYIQTQHGHLFSERRHA